MPQEYASSIELGDHVKDPITGFEGPVTSTTKYLHGCERCCVTAHELDKDGKEITEHFDVAQLTVIEAGKHAPKPRNYPAPPGGPARSGDPAPRTEGSSQR